MRGSDQTIQENQIVSINSDKNHEMFNMNMKKKEIGIIIQQDPRGTIPTTGEAVSEQKSGVVNKGPSSVNSTYRAQGQDTSQEKAQDFSVE